MLIEFFISANYEFSQIGLLKVRTQRFPNINFIYATQNWNGFFNVKFIGNLSKPNSSTSKFLSASGFSAKLKPRRI